MLKRKKPSIMSLAGRNVNAFQPTETQLSNPKLSTSYLSFKTKMLKTKVPRIRKISLNIRADS